MGTVGTVPGSNGTKVARKNVVIADDSMFTVIIGFWGDDAVNMEIQGGSTILAIKNAQVSDYAGKSLNCNPNHTSKIFLDPQMEKTKDLLHWYYNMDDDSRNEFKALSRGVQLDSNTSADEIYNHKFINNTVKPLPKDIDDYMVKKDNEKEDEEMNA